MYSVRHTTRIGFLKTKKETGSICSILPFYPAGVRNPAATVLMKCLFIFIELTALLQILE